MPRWMKSLLFVAPALLALAASCNGMRKDELACEQAVLHLRDCCPGFSAQQVSCYYEERQDCSGNTVGHEYPAISEADAQCIRAKSCKDLQDAKLCDGAQVAQRKVDSLSDAGPAPYEPPSLCN